MTRAIGGFALALAVLLTTNAGFALAADGDSAKPESKTESKTESKPAKSSGGGGGGNFFARGASLAAGLVFGTPISIVRRTGEEIVQGTRDLCGDTDNWFIMVPAGALTVPFGCVSGAASGVVHGAKNAWTGSADEPFGKDAFSLGEM